MREAISKGSSVDQLQHELKALSKEDRQSLLHEATDAVAVSNNDVLAMKADLSVPWNKLRILRRLKTYKCNTYFHWLLNLDG